MNSMKSDINARRWNGTNSTENGTKINDDDDWTQVRKAARRTVNPRTRKLVIEKSARDLLTILTLFSIVPRMFTRQG